MIFCISAQTEKNGISSIACVASFSKNKPAIFEGAKVDGNSYIPGEFWLPNPFKTVGYLQ